jgi:hypothetical protein
MSIKHLYPIAIAVMLGCATTGAPSDTPHKMTNFLTAQEIIAANADVNTAYDAVARLRPNWLAPRGAMSSNTEATGYATVYLDGQLYGGIETLRNIAAYHVADMRYYDVTQAGARFGVRAGTSGAIEVRTNLRK